MLGGGRRQACARDVQERPVAHAPDIEAPGRGCRSAASRQASSRSSGISSSRAKSFAVPVGITASLMPARAAGAATQAREPSPPATTSASGCDEMASSAASSGNSETSSPCSPKASGDVLVRPRIPSPGSSAARSKASGERSDERRLRLSERFRRLPCRPRRVRGLRSRWMGAAEDERLREYERGFRRAGLPLFIAERSAATDIFNRAVPLIGFVFLVEVLRRAQPRMVAARERRGGRGGPRPSSWSGSSSSTAHAGGRPSRSRRTSARPSSPRFVHRAGASCRSSSAASGSARS